MATSKKRTKKREEKDRAASPQVPGFRAAGVRCGIKKTGLDLALIVSETPAAAAGVFTRSHIVGAPVEVSRKHIASGWARGVVVNSGISNVGMGKRGLRDAEAMTVLAGRDRIPTRRGGLRVLEVGREA